MKLHRLPILIPAAAAALCMVAACGGGEEEDTGPVVSAEAMAEAETIFNTLCVTCHGMEGKGDGPGGIALVPPPADLSLPAKQAEMTDQHIFDIILGGGPAVGKALAMPANPQLKSKHDVVHGLVAKVRELERK